MKFTWPWWKYAILLETDLKEIQIIRVSQRNMAVWDGWVREVVLLSDGTWKDRHPRMGFKGTWKPYKWILPWKRPKLLELNTGAKRIWLSSLNMSPAPSVGQRIIWGVTPMGLLGALGATTLSLLLVLLLFHGMFP